MTHYEGHEASSVTALANAEAALAAVSTNGNVRVAGFYNITNGSMLYNVGMHFQDALGYHAGQVELRGALRHLADTRPAGAPVWGRADWQAWNSARQAFVQSTGAHSYNTAMLLDRVEYNITHLEAEIGAYTNAQDAVRVATEFLRVVREDLATAHAGLVTAQAAAQAAADVITTAQAAVAAHLTSPCVVDGTYEGTMANYATMIERVVYLDDRILDLRVFLDRSGYGYGS